MTAVNDNSASGNPPSVTVVACPDPPADWAVYDVKTGQKVPQPSIPNAAPPPWQTTYTVQRFNDKWLVAVSKTDSTKTCAS